MELKLKVFIGVAVALVAGGILYAYLAVPRPVNPDANLITHVDRALTPQERTDLEAKVAELKANIKNPPKGQEGNVLAYYLELGIRYESLGELGLERDTLVTATKLYPKNSLPWENLGVLYQEMGSAILAQQALAQATTVEPTDVSAWQKLIELNRYKLAASDASIRDLYHNALQATNTDPNLFRDYGNYLVQTKAYAEAKAVWQTIVLQHPEDAAAKQELQDIAKLQPK